MLLAKREPMLDARYLVRSGLATEEPDEGSVVQGLGIVGHARCVAVTREYAPRLPDPYYRISASFSAKSVFDPPFR